MKKETLLSPSPLYLTCSLLYSEKEKPLWFPGME